jgi:hypothetical protein
VNAALALAAILVSGADNPWSSGPPAPQPTNPSPFPQAPREPGAHVEIMDVPPVPPDPRGVESSDGVFNPMSDPRFSTTRTRSDLYEHGALSPATALVDVPGLQLRHEQAGNARMLTRGLDDRDIDVTIDDVPLFDLGGLVPPLEQFSNASVGSLTFHSGPRAWTSSPKGAAGVLAIDTLDSFRDVGENLGLRGALGGGYGGADLEKGVFSYVETGYGRAQLSLHATLLDREDQRLGRGVLAAGQEPGGLVFGSGGDGGALGARADIVPMHGLHVFTTWLSARTVNTPDPAHCKADDAGHAGDCSVTDERGVDVWIAGVDSALDLAGAGLAVHGRAHIQHGVATEERSGSQILVDEHAFDDGVRAGALTWLDARLPPVALLDVFTPRASIGVDLYADRFSSTFFVRSTNARDAEPPGNGLPDASRARLASLGPDGDVQGYGALTARIAAEGQRATFWADGKVASASATGNFAAGEIGAKAKVIDEVDAYVTGVKLQHDATLEGGLDFTTSWLAIGGDLFGSSRDAAPTIGGEYVPADSAAYGVEARAELRPGIAGLRALADFTAVLVDDGKLFSSDRVPQSGVPNPAGVVELAWDPPPNDRVSYGFFSRARFWLPQQRLSPAELTDRALCPELPSPLAIAAGATQQSPCSGAPGGFLFDVGAHITAGGFRLDAAAENLLDQQFALRDEPIGFGGTAFRAMLTLAL